jgi:hypothetical protein
MNQWRCARYELDGDIGAETKIYAGSGRQLDVIPYVLYLSWIVYYDEVSGDLPTRRPLPLLIYFGGVELQEKYPSRLYGKYSI